MLAASDVLLSCIEHASFTSQLRISASDQANPHHGDKKCKARWLPSNINCSDNLLEENFVQRHLSKPSSCQICSLLVSMQVIGKLGSLGIHGLYSCGKCMQKYQERGGMYYAKSPLGLQLSLDGVLGKEQGGDIPAHAI